MQLGSIAACSFSSAISRPIVVRIFCEIGSSGFLTMYMNHAPKRRIMTTRVRRSFFIYSGLVVKTFLANKSTPTILYQGGSGWICRGGGFKPLCLRLLPLQGETNPFVVSVEEKRTRFIFHGLYTIIIDVFGLRPYVDFFSFFTRT